MDGRIVRLNPKGQFGFIKGDPDNLDRFFHRSDVRNRDYSELKEGDRVSFDHVKGPKGPRAQQVVVLESAQAPAQA
jgi:CspA family cold shock protein